MLKTLQQEGTTRLISLNEHIHSICEAAKIGPCVLARTLRELCHKQVRSPGTLFNIVEGKVRVAKNLDFAADSLVILHTKLGIKVEISDQEMEIPDFFKRLEYKHAQFA